jgi:hypothetical protein
MELSGYPILVYSIVAHNAYQFNRLTTVFLAYGGMDISLQNFASALAD